MAKVIHGSCYGAERTLLKFRVIVLIGSFSNLFAGGIILKSGITLD